MHGSIERSPQTYARIAGLLYLLIIALGLFGEAVVRGSLVVAGDAAATAQAISGSPTLWRAGIAGDLLMHVLDVPVLLVFYLLLRPVSESLALLATFFNLVQTAVLAANKLTLLAPLLLLEKSGGPGAAAASDVHTLSALAIGLHGHGFGIGLVFFGMACLVRGVLLIRSGYFPKVLGVLLFVAGLCYLVNSFALIVWPPLADALFPVVLLPAFVAELALAVWLVAKGVDLPAWQKRVGPLAPVAGPR